jgi:phosphatidylglycerophosphate synthase
VVFKARWSGKLVTVLQLVTLAAVLLAPAALPLLLVAVAIISTISIVDYTLALWRARAT